MFDTIPPLSVLVVEENEDGAESTAMLLRGWGHRVIVARTGLVAIELKANDPLDVALLDIGLPGIDGWKLARLLRDQSRGKRPLLFAVTGAERTKTVEDRLRPGSISTLSSLLIPRCWLGCSDGSNDSRSRP
jgi:CheY-like chemotaxis protein